MEFKFGLVKFKIVLRKAMNSLSIFDIKQAKFLANVCLLNSNLCAFVLKVFFIKSYENFIFLVLVMRFKLRMGSEFESTQRVKLPRK